MPTVRDIVNKDKCLYHYTSENGILGMFKDKNFTLQLSRANSLNDKTEGKDLFICLEEVCKKMLNGKQISQTLYNNIISIYSGNLSDAAEQTLQSKSTILRRRNKLSDTTTDTFIMSFSKKPDCLPMWNYYTHAGTQGYSIQISTNKLLNCIKKFYSDNDIFFNNIDFCNVIYKNEEKEELLETAINEIDDEKNINKFIKKLNDYQYIFKHESFEYEEEVRLIIKIPKNSTTQNKLLNFRTRNGIIVPFIQLDLGKIPNNTVSEIMIGPLSNDAVANENLRMFLEFNGHSNINIRNSDIPIRF